MIKLLLINIFMAWICGCSAITSQQAGNASLSNQVYNQIIFTAQGDPNGTDYVIDTTTGNASLFHSINGVSQLPSISCAASANLLASLTQTLAEVNPTPIAGSTFQASCINTAAFSLYEVISPTFSKVISPCNYSFGMSDQMRMAALQTEYVANCAGK